MSKIIKKTVALLLAVAMVFGVAPISKLFDVKSVFTPTAEASDVEIKVENYSGHSYALINTKMNWHSAKEYCESLGGHLVTITSKEENDFIASNFSSGFMIGLTDEKKEGVWEWITGEDFEFKNWRWGEPNNQANEDYVLMDASDKAWNDGHCERENWPFICEWEYKEEYNKIEKLIGSLPTYDMTFGEEPIDPSDILNNISLESSPVDGPSINILGTEIKLFSLDVGLKLPIGNVGFKGYYDKDNQTYKLTLGNKGTVSVGDSEKDEFLEEYENFKNFYNVSKQKNIYAQRQAYQKIQGLLDKTPGLAGVDADMQVCGFFEFDVSKKPYRLTETGITVTADVSYSADFPFWYVFYATFSLGVEAGVDLAYRCSSSGDFSMSDFYGQFTVAPHIGFGVGGKVLSKSIASLEVGIEGKLESVFKIPVSSNSLTVTLKGNAYLKGNLFVASFKKDLQFGNGLQLYPKASAASYSLRRTLPEINYDDFQLNGREYLDYKTIGTQSFDGLNINSVENTLNSIYPYSCPKIIALENGKYLVVWLDDDGSKSAANLTTLYYMYFDGESWSAPSPVCETGCADFEANLVTDGSNVYMVYLRATSQMEEEDFSVEDFIGNLELVYSQFNGESWSQPMTVANGNVISDYAIVRNNESVYVAWSENESDIMSTNGNSVFLSEMTNNSFSSRQVISDDVGLIDSFVIGVADNEVAVMYCINGTLYKNGTVFSSNNASNITYQNGCFYWLENKVLMRLDGSTKESTDIYVSGSYKVISNNELSAVVFISENGMKNELSISYFDSSRTFPLSNIEKSISFYDAVMREDGSVLLVTAEETVYDSANPEAVQLTDLVIRNTDGFVDLSVGEYAYYDANNLIGGNTVRFETELKNNGLKDVSSYEVMLVDSEENVLVSQTVNDTISSGEIKPIFLDYVLPNDISRTTLKLVVSNREDVKNDNNMAIIEYGYSDILINSCTYENGVIDIVAENAGYENAENVCVTIKQLVGDTEYEEIASYSFECIEKQASKSASINIEEYITNFINNSDDEIYIAVELTSSTEEAELSNNTAIPERFSIYMRDSNSDGIPDYWFEDCALTDSDTIATEDPDDDSLTNLQEYERGTNPLNPDTDGDNVYDCVEAWNNLDPLEPMTDGVTDDYVVLYGTPDVRIDENSFNVNAETGEVSVSIVNDTDGKAMRATIYLYVGDELVDAGIVNLDANSSVDYVFSKDHLVDGMRIIVDEAQITRDTDYSNNEFVYVPATGIVVSNPEITIIKGLNVQLEYVITPEGASRIVEWNSADENIVSVNESGLISAVRIGKTTITVSTVSGCTGTYTVLVEPFPGAGETDFDCQLINNNTELEIIGYYGNDTDVVVPDSISVYPITSIANGAFDGCTFESITIGSDITLIGETSFDNAVNLKSIEVAEENPNYKADSGVLYNKDMSQLLRYPIAKEVTELTVPETVTAIGEKAFAGSSLLNSINIPESVVTISEKAFYNSSITSINYAGSQRAWNNGVAKASDSGIENLTVSFGKFTATFISEGEIISQTDHKSGEAITLPDDPTLKYYDFAGWSPEIPEGMPDCDSEFTAMWTLSATTRLVEYYVDGELYWYDYRNAGETVTSPETVPTKVGYTFANWSPDIAETMPDENLVYDAVWTVNIHQVAFVADENTHYTYKCAYGETLSVPEENPTKEGYIFTGWSAIPDSMPDADVEITAIFEPIVYNATFTDGENILGTDEFTVEDTFLDYPAVEAKAHYDWLWNKHTILADNITVSGYYTPTVYRVSFVSMNQVVDVQEFNVENTSVIPPEDVPSPEGYTGKWESFEIQLADFTVNAVYTPIIYTASYYCEGNLVGTRPFTVETKAEQIVIPALPERTGYTIQWTKFIAQPKDIDIYAEYVPIEYTAQFVADGEIVSTQTFTVESDGLNEPDIPQKAGYIANWSPYTISAGDKVITAKYRLPEVMMQARRTLAIHETYRLLPMANFTADEKVWTSSDTSVATVDQNGKVTALTDGECIITVTFYGKDSLGNDIQATATTKIIVEDEKSGAPKTFRELFDEFFEITLYEILFNFREFLITFFKYAY